MKNLSALLILFFSFLATADTKIFQIKGKSTELIKMKQMWLHCPNLKSCLAKNLKQDKSHCENIPLSQGNPSSYLCSKIPKTEIVIGFDQKRNEASFCYFEDQSVILADSLMKICQ